MFKHILFPTDGSATSESAGLACLRFAQEIGARVSAVHVMPEFHLLNYEPGLMADNRQQLEAHNLQQARIYLAEVEALAQQYTVKCDAHSVTSDHPHEAIIKLAHDLGCDLIVMASHGRKGIKGLLLGSETQKVLTHSTIPVLVYR